MVSLKRSTRSWVQSSLLHKMGKKQSRSIGNACSAAPVSGISGSRLRPRSSVHRWPTQTSCLSSPSRKRDMGSKVYFCTTCTSQKNHHISPNIEKRSHGQNSDTIFALSSGRGKAGVAVIRVSGPEAPAVLERLTLSRTNSRNAHNFPPRHASLRKFFHPESGNLLDQGLVIFFPGPDSFTGEDVVEFHLHGSLAVVRSMTEALQLLPGVRPADAGEFTERAFENYKMDLTEVEGLSDLLNAETEAQRVQALRQMSGVFGEQLEKWRTSLIKCLAEAEALIDFGDDELDVTEDILDGAIQRIQELVSDIKGHLDDERRGELIRDGISVAIVGPPNAGKSSLLNGVVKRDAAIVSPVAGTTRDIVEVHVELSGLKVAIADTAGIRDSDDVVEVEGVRRALKRAEEADIKVVVLDASNIQENHVSAELQDNLMDASIIVLNKTDLVSPKTLEMLTVKEFWEDNSIGLFKTTRLPYDREARDQLISKIVLMSCVSQSGLSAFMDRLEAEISKRYSWENGEASIITRARHRHHLLGCVDSLELAMSKASQADIFAEELRSALQSLSQIVGRVDVEEVLDVLFAEFCIGK